MEPSIERRQCHTAGQTMAAASENANSKELGGACTHVVAVEPCMVCSSYDDVSSIVPIMVVSASLYFGNMVYGAIVNYV